MIQSSVTLLGSTRAPQATTRGERTSATPRQRPGASHLNTNTRYPLHHTRACIYTSQILLYYLLTILLLYFQWDGNRTQRNDVAMPNNDTRLQVGSATCKLVYGHCRHVLIVLRYALCLSQMLRSVNQYSCALYFYLSICLCSKGYLYLACSLFFLPSSVSLSSCMHTRYCNITPLSAATRNLYRRLQDTHRDINDKVYFNYPITHEKHPDTNKHLTETHRTRGMGGRHTPHTTGADA